MATRILVVDDSPTIRRVVSTILERHGYEPALASDGQDALDVLLSGEVKADLVLLDFVMPRLNGYQFCRALREKAEPELAQVPIVLMSAKGDRIRDQFVQQTGAIDAITKPFDARALVAVVENALRRVNTTRASSARLPEDFDEDMPTSVGSISVPPEVIEQATRRTNIAQILGQKLAHIATRAIEEKPDARGAELEAHLGSRLEDEAILEMIEVVRELAPASHKPGTVLSGDLAAIPIGAVLQLLQAEIQSGILVCKGDHVEIVATFRAGLIDLVQSSGAGDEFRLGRYFVEEGILTAEQIDEVLRQRAAESQIESDKDGAPASEVRMLAAPPAPAPRPLGTMLLAAGKIDDTQLRAALTKQSNELLYDVLRWQKGRFELRREPPGELADNAKLSLPVASVVMEGFRRVDEWRVLERTLDSFDGVLVRDDAAFGSLDIGSLPVRERILLDAVDGERTIRQIIAASPMSSFDACRTLVQFLEARVLRRR